MEARCGGVLVGYAAHWAQFSIDCSSTERLSEGTRNAP
jgi:hypothetical protein